MVTWDDFNKIWASTSPLTPYSFSDAQYKEGWNFVGGTPPSRQMWDFLQKNNDEKALYLLNNFDNYLPLSGGTLTGDVLGVTPPNGDNSKKIANTEFIQALASILVPIGCVQAYAGNTLPNGWLLCDGSEINRVDYADLFVAIGTAYGSGDGSTTFNLPNLTDKFIEGSATAGTVKSAGLPNITGTSTYDIVYNAESVQRGALKNTNYAQSPGLFATGSMQFGYMDIELDASKSNPIYGNSNTVQPSSVTMRYIIKY